MRQVTFWREKISDPFILLRIPSNFLRYTQSNSVTFPVDPLDKVNRNNAHQGGNYQQERALRSRHRSVKTFVSVL